MNLSDLTVSVSSEIVEDIAAIVSIDKGSVTASDFSVTTDGEKAPVAIAVTANTSADNINISNSNIIVDIPADADQSLVDKVTSDSSTALSYDAASAEEFSNALTEYGRVRLTGDITLTSWNMNSIAFDALDVNLNENALTINYDQTVEIPASKTLVIHDGDLNYNYQNPASGTAPSCFAVEESSTLKLLNLAYTPTQSGIFVEKEGARLIVEKCIINSIGPYALGTNATENVKVYIDIIDTTITSEQKTGILFNVSGEMNITNSTITTGTQSVIARGGITHITNSHLTTTGFWGTGLEYMDKEWKTGNSVPYGALVIGNRKADTYEYTTTVYLDEASTVNVGENPHSREDVIEAYISSDNNYDVNLWSDNEVVETIKSEGYFWGETTYINGTQIKDSLIP